MPIYFEKDPILATVGLGFPVLGRPVKKALELWGQNQVFLPLSSGLYALHKRDYRGFCLLAGAVIVNQIFIELLKRVLVPEIRPNGRDGSFPSGHTAAAFLGPAFLVCRYGFSSMPLPIALSAAVSVTVGISRVLLKAHWVHDVIGGAALGCSVIYMMVGEQKKAKMI